MEELTDNPITIDGTCYFASDFHFGAPDEAASAERENRVLMWLDEVLANADALFLLGDIFDFWFEYRDVVPRGYYRLFSKFHEIHEKGIPVFYFTGNHDMWVDDYFVKEFGFQIFRRQQFFIVNGKRCLVGHGDGLGKGDLGYKFIKRVFAFRPNVWLYGLVHPRIAFSIARFFSHKSRAMTGAADNVYMGEEKEMLAQYALTVLKNHNIDFFIYGHRHLPLDIKLNEKSRYINIGDWLVHDSYCKFDKEDAKLLYFKNL